MVQKLGNQQVGARDSGKCHSESLGCDSSSLHPYCFPVARAPWSFLRPTGLTKMPRSCFLCKVLVKFMLGLWRHLCKNPMEWCLRKRAGCLCSASGPFLRGSIPSRVGSGKLSWSFWSRCGLRTQWALCHLLEFIHICKPLFDEANRADSGWPFTPATLHLSLVQIQHMFQ